MQKRQTLRKGFALLENDITDSWPTFKILDTLQILQVLGSRYHTPIYTVTGVFCRQGSRQLCYRFNAWCLAWLFNRFRLDFVDDFLTESILFWFEFVKLVRRRHKHVGAPDNRIKSLWIENVLTPQGKDMILELGPDGHRPTINNLQYFYTFSNKFIQLLVKIEDNSPYPQTNVNFHRLHISQNPWKIKRVNPLKRACPYPKTISQDFL